MVFGAKRWDSVPVIPASQHPSIPAIPALLPGQSQGSVGADPLNNGGLSRHRAAQVTTLNPL